MSLFTPVVSILGGSLIAMAADVLLLWNGDILGMSGIFSTSALQPTKMLTEPSQYWKFVFLASFLMTGTYVLAPRFDMASAYSGVNTRPLSPAGYVLAGLLVGFGTKMSNGCTSGHGICGLGRRSPRSLAAVLSFMASGIATSILTSPTSSFAESTAFLRTDEVLTEPNTQGAMLLSAVPLIMALIMPFVYSKKKSKPDDRAKAGAAAVGGALMAAALYVSEMALPARIWGFLDFTKLLDGSWDPSLMLVFGSGLLTSFVGYQFLEQYRVFKSTKTLGHPMALSKDSKFGVPTSTAINVPLILGSLLFGVGWGIGSVCPGPGFLLASMGAPLVLSHWMPAFFLGSYMAQQLT